MATSLVTGGAGFIGSHLTGYLIERGDTVIVVDDLSGGFEENIHPKADFHAGSITDNTFINRLFEKHSIDYVYHLAAYAAEGLSHFIRRFNYTNNLIGSVNVINAAIRSKVKCFVFTSSIAVYGENEVPHTENQVPSPLDPYGIAKYAVELDLKNAQTLFGLNSIVFRPHNVYGPKQNIGDKYRNVVGIFMNQCLKNEPMTIFGDGSQTRAFSYIDDIIPTLANSVLTPFAYNQTFNLGADTVTSVNELSELIRTEMHTSSAIDYVEQREEAQHAHADHSKLHSFFEATPETSITEGIHQMAHWVKQHGARESHSFGHIEITEKLPSSWK